ncbi:lipid phosphate phosphatase 2-like isoform X1 [Neltuma alba]|uniref:lipid phosphate phosphatase 2-like isoform X1 n=1 Tax=Neltuma alba TaxID=207710 RepID=UPI0010A4BD16|nr:lipid phosphate phosphatase 2-like isoform X1 [Prosopis alba]
MAWKDVLSSLFPFGRFLALLKQVSMGQVDPAAHTIKSHGASLARNHLQDWLILLFLLVLEVILYAIHPFYRFVGRDMMEDLKYPMKDNTVPVWAVPLYAVLLPIAVFLFFYMRRRDVYDLHHSILAGLLYAVLVTAVMTDAIKDAVGRPRPDFFWRCFPDGIEVYNKWGGVVCHGKAGDIKEGHKSFPSGHTSWSFAGLGFLSLYLSGKIKAFDRRGHVAKLCIVFLPLLAASLVGVSRVDDYWHHWQDVFAGGLLGLVVATFCYRQFFPPPYNDDGWGTYAYFQAVEEESRANANRNNQNTAVGEQDVETGAVNPGARRNRTDAFTHFPLHCDDIHSPTLEAMELERK